MPAPSIPIIDDLPKCLWPLKGMRRWCLWRFEEKGGKLTKPPFQAKFLQGPRRFKIGRRVYILKTDWQAWLEGLAESGGAHGLDPRGRD